MPSQNMPHRIQNRQETFVLQKTTGCQQLSDREIRAFFGQQLELRIHYQDTLHLELFSASSCLTSELSPSACIRISDHLVLRTDSESVWRIEKDGHPLLSCEAYTIEKDSSGNTVSVKCSLKANHRHVFGTGERFDAVDQQGLGSSGTVKEQFTHQGSETYLPLPFFFTEKNWAWFADSSLPVRMAFSDAQIVMDREASGNVLSSDYLFFGDPGQMIHSFLSMTGSCTLPPEWAFGVWISSNGWHTDAEVQEQLDYLKKYQYPASVMVLEQWSDEQTFYRWNTEHFPAPENTIRAIRESGLHPVLWQIPVIKQEKEHRPIPQLIADTEEAIQKGYVIRNQDGHPCRIPEGCWFSGSLLPDFTNPEAVSWWFSKRKYLLDMGVEGFKTDGGEFLYAPAARLESGLTGWEAHNLYPVLYEQAYAQFLQENHVEGVLFSRAGYTGAQSVPIHWAGDQKSEWSELQAQLTAGLSAGLSGVLFWSFDIGGFAGAIPNKELYLRATAMGCFSPVMQWHSEPRNGQFSGGKGEAYNNDRSPWNLAAQWNDPEILRIGCSFARLREELRPYLLQEAQYCVSHGRPMMAHPVIDWPDDPRAWDVQDEYMLGRSLLTAPITKPHCAERKVWLPSGVWQDYFTKKTYEGNQIISIDCPLDKIPVFKLEARMDA